MLALLVLRTADANFTGKLDRNSLSEQALMEIVFNNVFDKTHFCDEAGIFIDIHLWPGLYFHPNGTVKAVVYDTVAEFCDDLFGDRCVLWPGGSADLHWIPSQVQNLILSSAGLEGSIITEALPRGLLILICDANHFTGSFRIECLPPAILQIDIMLNKFFGTLNLEELPDSVEQFNASENDFSGSIDLSCLPQCLKCLFLNGNRFSGEICLEKLPEKIESIYLQSNETTQFQVLIDQRASQLGILTLDNGMFTEIKFTDGSEPNIWPGVGNLIVSRK